ncbi:MAG: response regulator [Deltaproteobacteria bacterium]|nr:response regulator [Deltaproteobacteria bacterium]
MQSGAKKILIVDDEETVGIGMSEILKDAGYGAAYVTSGAAAVDAVREQGYSLIFIDMIMPDMNGLETYRRIRQFNKDARVVLFTGYFRDAERAIFNGVKEGMIDVYIRKPFFAEEVVHTAKKYA